MKVIVVGESLGQGGGFVGCVLVLLAEESLV